MNRFQEFATNHYTDDLSELKSISIEELNALLFDYLSLELFQYTEDEYDSVDAIISQLKQYLEDPKTFYFNLIVDFVNMINFSGHKGIVLQLGNESQYHEDEHHFYYRIDTEGDMREAFLFLYHSFHDTKEEENIK